MRPNVTFKGKGMDGRKRMKEKREERKKGKREEGCGTFQKS